MAGALTERDFVAKLERAGFTKIEIVERTPMGIDDCTLYPLFTTEVLELMRALIRPQRQQTIGTAIVVRARLDPRDHAREDDEAVDSSDVPPREAVGFGVHVFAEDSSCALPARSRSYSFERAEAQGSEIVPVMVTMTEFATGRASARHAPATLRAPIATPRLVKVPLPVAPR